MALSPLLLLSLYSMGAIATKPALVTADVRLNGRGPFRFLVDTGAESTLLQSALAAELGIEPQFRVELVTVNGSSLVPGARLRGLVVGATRLPELEILFDNLTQARQLDPAIVGVLGANALSHFDFQILPSAGRLESSAIRPSAGEVIPFSLLNGRMIIEARMGQENLPLVLDSGASHVVLFRTPLAMAKTRPVPSAVNTMDGARNVVPTLWTADMTFSGRLRVGMLPAAIVQRPEGQAAGLLPASVFKKIFVDHARQELVVER
jgi:predicted aspartyl protease